jgi:hypothetical protein
MEACNDALQTLGQVLGQWQRLKDTDSEALNEQAGRRARYPID